MTSQTSANLLFALFLLEQIVLFILGGLFVRWVETRREIREIKK